MPRYNRLRTSGDRAFSDRDSYLFQASEDPVAKAAPHSPVASGMLVSSGPPSSSADEGNGLAETSKKQHGTPGNGQGPVVDSPAKHDVLQSNVVVEALVKPQGPAKQPAPTRKGGPLQNRSAGASRFGATLQRVASFRDTGKQSKYSRIPSQGGDWGEQGVDGKGKRESGGVDIWEQQQPQAPGPAANSILTGQRAWSLRDAGSWAAAVQRTASIRDPGGHYHTQDYRGSGSLLDRHVNASVHPVLEPIPLDRNSGKTDSFERNSPLDRGYGRGRGGAGYGDDCDVFVPTRERHGIPSSLGAAVHRALSLREDHLAVASSLAAQHHHHHPQESQHQPQRFYRARDRLAGDYATPVYSRSGDPEDWEKAEMRFWAGASGQKVHSQSMRYDRVTIPMHDMDAEDDYSHRSSSVGEKDRNACMSAADVLKRSGSAREQVSKGGMSSARVYSMREHSHFLQCTDCGKALGAVTRGGRGGRPATENAKICQSCSRTKPPSHWTDPANGKDAIPTWAVPPRKKKGLFQSWRRMLGLKTPAATGAAT